MRISDGRGDRRSAPVRGMLVMVLVWFVKRCRLMRGANVEEEEEVMLLLVSPSTSSGLGRFELGGISDDSVLLLLPACNCPSCNRD